MFPNLDPTQLIRPLLWSLLAFVALQAIVIMLLMHMSRRRKNRVPESGFPSLPPEALGPIEVAENQLQLYMRGGPLYEAMIEAIEGAEKEIFFESYIWKDDEVGQSIKAALEAKAREGIPVYVIYDALGNFVVPDAFFAFGRAVNVLPYKSWNRLRDVVTPTRWGRDHRKILVVDREMAFVGGYNIGAHYRDYWRDTHLRLIGPAARDLAYAFSDFWNAWTEDSQPAIPQPQRPWSAHLRVHRNDRRRLMFPIRSVYSEAIEHASKRIELTSAYFVPDRALLAALRRAARRGVDVRILVPKESNHILVDWLSRSIYDEVLGSGIRIFRYAGAMIHAKTCTIDGVWSMVGTANLDRLSLAGNHEINVEIFDKAFAATMSRVFECDLGNARELRQSVWQRRPRIARVGEWILAPLRPFV